MTEDKQKTLSRLYALRAGLSIVSMEKDKTDKIVNSALTKKKNAEAAAESFLAEAKAKVDEKQNLVQEAETNQNDNLEIAEGSRRSNFLANIAAIFIFALILILLFCAAHMIIYFCFEGGVFKEDWQQNKFLNFFFGWLLQPGRKPNTWEAKDDIEWYLPVGLILLIGALPADFFLFRLLQGIYEKEMHNKKITIIGQ